VTASARVLAGLCALAALGALGALALPRGLADLRALEARLMLTSWQAARRAPAADEWMFAYDRLRVARALDSTQPAYLEDTARLHELRALSFKAGDARVAGELREALGMQRRILPLRPGSAYAWSSIALLKARLREVDREFESALRNAALFGPWEPEVQLALAEAGFRHWAALGPATRAALEGNAQRALRRQDAKLFEIARRHGRLSALCSIRGVERSPQARVCI